MLVGLLASFRHLLMPFGNVLTIGAVHHCTTTLAMVVFLIGWLLLVIPVPVWPRDPVRTAHVWAVSTLGSSGLVSSADTDDKGPTESHWGAKVRGVGAMVPTAPSVDRLWGNPSSQPFMSPWNLSLYPEHSFVFFLLHQATLCFLGVVSENIQSLMPGSACVSYCVTMKRPSDIGVEEVGPWLGICP